MVRVDDKIDKMNKCTSILCHFDGNADAWVQCSLYCPMQHVGAKFEASGCRHRATTCSVLPWRPPGQQETQQQQQNAPVLLIILVAMAVCQYDTAHIA
jgi:hypothetical protein